ncbi:hypothetical protein O4H48_13960 [Rhodobacteraceae bacterium G21628-S1]|nr:hypothetical protein [Rhodobacteraceae bacterium G21628-S1]
MRRLIFALAMLPGAAMAEPPMTILTRIDCRDFTYLYNTPSSDVSAGQARNAHTGMQLFIHGMLQGTTITFSDDQRYGLISGVLRKCEESPQLPFAAALKEAVGEIVNPE